ncbi:antitoxin [Streptomyces thermodiastaticus]|uniref:antitoxin n=1 Tax=Streptomyces sp. WAC00469 TaxID=2487415 RepID=UPI000F73746A|nr:antitoxin [Streptomyces sp. WAC00469]RSS03869.1 antitoxin [Streptomyces sp. WAC00469]
MGLLDNVKAKLGPAKEKVSDLAQRHGGSIEHGLDKAARMVDEKTKGKYSDRIHAGTGKAKEAVERLAHRGGTGPDTGTAPGDGTGTAQGGPRTQTPPEPPQGQPPVS